MKTNSFFSALALCAGILATSCSQEEVMSNGSPAGPITLQINIPAPVTRAMPTVPDGYQLRCMMDLVDTNGDRISDTERIVQTVSSDNLTFTFNAPDNEYSCLFWADYVPTSSDINTDNLYNTTDLTNVTYAKTGNDLFNNDAADAFYGSVSSAMLQNAITLSRPFARVNIMADPDVADQYTAYDQVSAIYDAPSGFNVMDGSISSTAAVSYSGPTSEDYWFSTYIFAGVNKTSISGDINLTLTDTEAVEPELSLHIAGSAIAVDGNQWLNVEVTPTVDGDTDITITFPSDMQDPNAPYVFKVGDYINAAGEPVADASSAVAIVFATAEDKDDASDYGEGKTPQAYAISLVKATGRDYIKDGGSGTWTVTLTDNSATDAASPYSGYMFSDAILTTVGDFNSTMFNNYKTWLGTNALTGENLSAWYIPSFQQLSDAVNLNNEALKNAFDGAFSNPNGSSTYFLFSSTVINDKSKDTLCFKGIAYTPGTGREKDTTIDPNSHRAIVFPVVTIFK